MASESSWLPSGVTPVRKVLKKSVSLQPCNGPPGVRLDDGPAPGGSAPLRSGPSQKAQPLTEARYPPYSAVTPSSGADGSGVA